MSDTPQGTPQNEQSIRCEEIESLAVLYACDELDAGARAQLDAHVAQCPACAAVVSREGRLQQAVASLEQPADSLDRSGLLLAQCRSELAESLDDRKTRADSSAWPSIFSPVAWWGASAPYADLSSGDEHDGAGGGGISRGRRGTKTARRSAAGGSTRPARHSPPLQPCRLRVRHRARPLPPTHPRRPE